MPRSVPEWIGKTDDTKVPDRVKLRIFDAHKGICWLSKRQIQAGEAWELHHIKALIENGENRESNLAPVLTQPHKAETKRQRAVKKKVDATRKKHLGITKPKQKIPSQGFQSSRKKSRFPKEPLKPKQFYRSA
ncbi:MAG: HNH endonuclease [Desulfobacteraceae bacterium]|nr:HNH endonuclease [Desulfobacteraceae bacterium]